MTTLAITPNWKNKSAKFKGTVAAGEHVSVAIQNDDGEGGEFIADASTLRLRIVDPCNGRTLAIFPEPVPEGETPEEWDSDLTPLRCTLNLNTIQMLKAVPPAANVPLLFVLDDYENKTLYFKETFPVEHWPRLRGEEEPTNLDDYKDIIADFNTRLDGYDSRITAAESVANAATENASAASSTAEQAKGIANQAVGKAEEAKSTANAVANNLEQNYYTADETNEAIDRVAAYYITYTAAGAAFPTRAALLDGLAYYSGGELRVPTRNDYAIVLADESHGGAEWRYIYAVADGAMTGQWEAQYPVEGVITFDNAVTKDSTNGVKSSGIWSAIWGALASLPTGFASLYDWCVSQLAGKLGNSGAQTIENGSLTVNGNISLGSSANIRKFMFNSTCGVYYDVRGGVAKGITISNGQGTDVFIPLDDGEENTAALWKDVIAAVQQIAPAWASNTAYAANKLCSYNGVVYQNTSGATIQSATTPDTSGSGWTAKPVSDLFLPLTGGEMTGALTVPKLSVGSQHTGTIYNDGKIQLRGGGNGEIRFPTSGGGSILNIPYLASNTSGTLALAAGPNHAGNLAALDASGNPTDSGVKASDKLDASSASAPFSSDSSVSYPVGSHVTYNGALYVCTTATTGGTWVAGSWTADTMTDPDAVLDVTSQNQLCVVAKDGTVLWAQGYDLASTSSATLACDATNNFTFADGATTQAFTLPTAPTGKVGDFGLDIDNSANTGAATMTLTGLDTAFSVIVPKGESLNDMLAIAAGELARFYVSLSTFRVNNLPTWHIVKQIVENGGATV